jgi:hypothetical protein
MNESPLMGPTNGLFSPADFADAEDLRPTAAIFDIGGNGSITPYTTATNAILSKHIDEIKQKTAAALTMPSGWKKRLREFLAQKNTQLLDFLAVNVNSHPTLGKGETILRKFGNLSVQTNPNHPSVRDLVLDLSGADYVSEINALLLSLRKDDGIKDFVASVKFIFDQYREAGEEALRHDSILRGKLEVFDKFQGRIGGLFELDGNEKYQPLMEATESYLETIFEKNKIKEAYTGFIEAYRKFIVLRDIVTMIRTIQSNENEPICTICLNEPVAFCMNPCGHTYCISCVRRQSGTCFVCRTPFKEKVKIYFS